LCGCTVADAGAGVGDDAVPVLSLPHPVNVMTIAVAMAGTATRPIITNRSPYDVDTIGVDGRDAASRVVAAKH
jgi:hypothetical protein